MQNIQLVAMVIRKPSCLEDYIDFLELNALSAQIFPIFTYAVCCNNRVNIPINIIFMYINSIAATYMRNLNITYYNYQ